MARATVTLVNRLGLHARAAAKFVNLAKTFESEVTLAKGNEPVDGKRIMRVMLLAAFTFLASPKSVTLGWPLGSNSTFAGFRSR